MTLAQTSSRWERLKGRTKRAWSELTRDDAKAVDSKPSLDAPQACEHRHVRGRDSYLRELLRLLRGRQNEACQCSSGTEAPSDVTKAEETPRKSPD